MWYVALDLENGRLWTASAQASTDLGYGRKIRWPMAGPLDGDEAGPLMDAIARYVRVLRDRDRNCLRWRGFKDGAQLDDPSGREIAALCAAATPSRNVADGSHEITGETSNQQLKEIAADFLTRTRGAYEAADLYRAWINLKKVRSRLPDLRRGRT